MAALRFPDGLDLGRFLARHWQKSPLFMIAALDTVEPALSPDELAWLATLPDVESRLIFTERKATATRYRIEHGPFDEQTLMRLPDNDWTLLVQDVEKHLPDFRAFFARVPFVPDWRVDDLMVSFAAPGGSVGPHRDNYDVFLCQGQGRRQWRLARPDDAQQCETSAELSLLQPFAGDTIHLASETDVLYLPPGVPHWGIAQDACVTYSIGMRAPEQSEFACACERLFPTRRLPKHVPQEAPCFYQDPDLDPDEAMPGLISERALSRARVRFSMFDQFSVTEFASIFGSLVTDPKAWLAPEGVSAAESRKIVRKRGDRSELTMHGMARVAFTPAGDQLQLFANGFNRFVDSAVIDQLATLCRQRALRDADLGSWCSDSQLREPLEWMLRCGVFDPGA